MATQAAAMSGYIADFAAKLLTEREVIPRAEIIVSQISEFFPEAGVVLYLLEENGSEAHWKFKAAKGSVSVPKHSVPRDSGTLAEAWHKREAIVFAGGSTAREKFSHIDVRRTIMSLGYLPMAIDEVFLGLIEVVSFDRQIESAELKRLEPFADFSALALSTALAYENERNGQFESINRMTQLYDLERSFNSTLKLDNLLPIITSKIRETIDVQAVNLWMVEEDSVVLMSRAGEDPTIEVGAFQKSGEGIASEVSDSGKGVVFQKATDERLMKRNEASPDKPVRAIIAVPIVSMNYQVGVLEVINRMDGKLFTEDDVFFINTILITVGSAMHNASLLEAERKIEILETLVEVSREITSSLNTDRIIQLVVNGPQKIMTYDRATVALEHHGKLQLKAISGKTEINSAEPSVKVLRGILEWAMHSEDEVYVVQHGNRVDADREETRLKFQEYFSQTGQRAFYSVPLADEQGRLGVLSFESRNPDFLSDTHFELIKVLASQTTVALRNASLYKEVPFIGVLEPLLQKKHEFMAMDSRRRSTYVVLAVATALFLVLCPLPLRVVGDATVTPETTSKIQTPVDGVVSRVFVREGDAVKAGTILADLEDWDYRSALASAQAKYATASAEMNRALSAKDGSEAGIKRLQVDYWASEVARARERLEKTHLRSTQDGIVATPHMEEMVGHKLDLGDTLATVVSSERAQVDIAIDEEDVPLIQNGDTAAIKIESFPTKKFTGTVSVISPISTVELDKRVFYARVSVPNSEGLMRPGMQGRGKISAGWHRAGFVIFRGVGMWAWAKIWTWFGW
jgi:RND family efflux transporter MFP subunit